MDIKVVFQSTLVSQQHLFLSIIAAHPYSALLVIPVFEFYIVYFALHYKLTSLLMQDDIYLRPSPLYTYNSYFLGLF